MLTQTPRRQLSAVSCTHRAEIRCPLLVSFARALLRSEVLRPGVTHRPQEDTAEALAQPSWWSWCWLAASLAAFLAATRTTWDAAPATTVLSSSLYVSYLHQDECKSK